MLEIKLRLLTPQNTLDNCTVRYELPRGENPLYLVCITNNGGYYVYDKVAFDPGIASKLRSIERAIYDLLMESDNVIEDLRRMKGLDNSLLYVVERQFIGYGLLEPLYLDHDVINMHIMPGKPVQIIHRVHGRLETNIVLSSEEVRELAMRISSTAGKALSEAYPLASFIEPRYESRVTIIYSSDITMKKNMVIDIRKPLENPWTILKLIDLGSLSFDEAAFLWLMVKYKVPVVIVGEMFTGKTTLATALLALVPPWSRVMTIEDAPEIRIPVEYWTRTTIRDFGEHKIGVFDLVKTSVRLSLDYVIIGEVRGEEAREWANAILLGHGAITTFHAESPETAILRLLSPPISVDPQIASMLNVFVKSNSIEVKPGRYVYRHEVYIHEEARVRPLFIYDRSSDKITLSNEFKETDLFTELKFIDRVIKARRVTRDTLRREYEAMKQVLVETYEEYKRIDPELNTPTYRELPRILYHKLFSRIQ